MSVTGMLVRNPIYKSVERIDCYGDEIIFNEQFTLKIHTTQVVIVEYL